MTPLTPDERAAMERLRANAYSDHVTINPPGDGPMLMDYSQERASDNIALAAALLRLHPPDDEREITEEWLREVGFVSGVNPYWVTSSSEVLDLAFSQEGRWNLSRRNSEYGEDSIFLPSLKTRGQLRRLCAALSILLKSQEPT